MNIKNTNDQGLTVSFTPDFALSNVVSPTSINLGPNEQKNVNLHVNIAGTDKSGDMYVEGACEDSSPISEGLIYLSVKGRGSVVSCRGTDSDCGMAGMCENVNQYDGCKDGYYLNYYCASNTKKFKSMCTNTCCNSVGGTCNNNICVVPKFSVNLPINITNSTGKPTSALVTLYEVGTTRVANSSTVNGYGVISSPNATVDLNLEYDTVLNIMFKNLDLTKMTSTFKMSMNKISTALPDANLIKAYTISTSQSSFDGILKFKYSSLIVNNEPGLAIYKCSSFNTTSGTCLGSWVKQSATLDSVNNIISTQITSFSVYALGESRDVTTTTTATTSPTTTISSNSGGSSGGSKTTTSTRTTTSIAQTTISCICESWTNLGCGQNSCGSNEMKQIRSCDPSACDSESRCIVDTSCAKEETTIKTEENLKATEQPTGLFLGIPNDIAKYAIPIVSITVVSVGIVIWKFNDKITSFTPTKSSKGYVFAGKHENPDFVELKIKEEPKIIVDTTPELKKQNAIEARNRAIEDMRKRAHEMDKK